MNCESKQGEFCFPIDLCSVCASGIGYASIVIVSLLNIYYIVILAWGLYYLLQCFQHELPWASCKHSWNTANCVEDTVRKNKSLWLAANITNLTNLTSPVTEFWEWVSSAWERRPEAVCTGRTLCAHSHHSHVACRRNVLSISSGIDEVGGLKWELALCLLAVWIICFFCIWKGVKSTGKVSERTRKVHHITLLEMPKFVPPHFEKWSLCFKSENWSQTH